jgi:hypothetical protein
LAAVSHAVSVGRFSTAAAAKVSESEMYFSACSAETVSTATLLL